MVEFRAPETRSAIVTGAARGIGRAIVTRLAADGLAVTAVDLASAHDGLSRVVADIQAAGGTAASSVADVRIASEVDDAVSAHTSKYGGLDVMVANAGVAVSASLVDTTAEQWETTMAVNLGGAFHCYQSAARQMISQGRGGRLIGAASNAAHRGGKWQSAYSASKFAIRGLTQSVAQELAEFNITVNVYSPGVVDTSMWESIDQAFTARRGTPIGSELASMVSAIPLGRLETPHDVAGVVSFLASPDAAYITGQSIVVDGGMWFS